MPGFGQKKGEMESMPVSNNQYNSDNDGIAAEFVIQVIRVFHL